MSPPPSPWCPTPFAATHVFFVFYANDSKVCGLCITKPPLAVCGRLGGGRGRWQCQRPIVGPRKCPICDATDIAAAPSTITGGSCQSTSSTAGVAAVSGPSASYSFRSSQSMVSSSAESTSLNRSRASCELIRLVLQVLPLRALHKDVPPARNVMPSRTYLGCSCTDNTRTCFVELGL